MKQNRILIALFILNYIILSINLLQFKFIKNLPLINSCMILNLIIIGIDQLKNERVAIKVENSVSMNPQLYKEYKTYMYLSQGGIIFTY